MSLFMFLFSTAGRIGRLRFWSYLVVYFMLWGGAWMLDVGLGAMDNSGAGLLSTLVFIILAIPTYAVCAKRAHDRGHPGWRVLLVSLIPIVGAVWLLVELGFLPGDRGTNKYGPGRAAPLAVGAAPRPAQAT